MTAQDTPIARALRIIGGQHKCASIFGVHQSTIAQWVARKSVPARHCRRIEFLTDGRVTRYQMRPEIFGTSADDTSLDGHGQPPDMSQYDPGMLDRFELETAAFVPLLDPSKIPR